MVRTLPLLLGLALALPSSAAAPAGAPAEVTLKAVNYSELMRLVRSLEGKVVLVDFWEPG